MMTSSETPRTLPRITVAVAAVALMAVVGFAVFAGHSHYAAPPPEAVHPTSDTEAFAQPDEEDQSPTTAMSEATGALLRDGINTQLAVHARDSDLYFRSTELMRQDTAALQNLVETAHRETQLDFRSLMPTTTQLYGKTFPATQLWGIDLHVSWAGFKKDLDNAGRDVSNTAHAVQNGAERAENAIGSDLSKAGNWASSHISSAERTVEGAMDKAEKTVSSAALALVSRASANWGWAKNQLCTRILKEVLEKMVTRGLFASGAIAACTPVCAAAVGAVELVGGGPLDPVADFVAVMFGPTCEGSCSTVLTQVGLQLIAATPAQGLIDKAMAGLCTAIHCGPVAPVSKGVLHPVALCKQCGVDWCAPPYSNAATIIEPEPCYATNGRKCAYNSAGFWTYNRKAPNYGCRTWDGNHRPAKPWCALRLTCDGQDGYCSGGRANVDWGECRNAKTCSQFPGYQLGKPVAEDPTLCAKIRKIGTKFPAARLGKYGALFALDGI